MTGNKPKRSGLIQAMVNRFKSGTRFKDRREKRNASVRLYIDGKRIHEVSIITITHNGEDVQFTNVYDDIDGGDDD